MPPGEVRRHLRPKPPLTKEGRRETEECPVRSIFLTILTILTPTFSRLRRLVFPAGLDIQDPVTPWNM